MKATHKNDIFDTKVRHYNHSSLIWAFFVLSTACQINDNFFVFYLSRLKQFLDVSAHLFS